ncbi:SIR2 family NAD-dependent protein deacylase [Bordetella trematum]|uniref:SIR2 family NAD-dependent protein deacylase n=1 Tax=Bordetella trematum TaxID=123899 RepID=UPI000F630B9C|nr:Sir2 family NAD-dependent protein deacetylase [Bordetella trematum]VDH04780.1 NAD-dependent deacetylase [Bordetella trematum]
MTHPPVEPTGEALLRAAQLIEAASSLLVVAGAGMGIDSGLPDFRSAQGFWRAYPALGRQNLSFAEIASPAAFRRDPQLAWGFYGHRLALYRATRAHAGFGMVHGWMQARPMGGAVFTSNVDGHFQQAGFDAQQLVECHGSLHRLQCLESCCNETWPADGFVPQVDEAQGVLLNEPPRCPYCGGLARPNVYMFNDHDWQEQPTRQQYEHLRRWLRFVEGLVILDIGAGTAIPTARAFSHRIAAESGAAIIRINPAEPQVPDPARDVSLPLAALPALTAIAQRLTPG